jgi:cytochrome c-type biogenesis protein CcmH
MTWFWILGVALAALALVLTLRPLLFTPREKKLSRSESNIAIYRDQLAELDADLAVGKLAPADHARSRAELEARLLQDVAPQEAPPSASPRGSTRALLVTLALAVPLSAALLYLSVGNPGALAPRADPHNFDPQQLNALVERLAAKMRENPDDAEGWKLLGRSYVALGRFPEALDAYAKAAARKPRDAELLADMADVLATTRSERLQGEPEKLVLRALEIDPQNLKALALAGTAAFDRRDYAGATRYWQRMLPLVEPGSEDARQIQASIAEARSRGGAPAAAAPRALQGKVSLSKKLAAQASPDDTVFIFARAAEGPPMPLAVKRARVRDLPFEFALDDSMAMAPGMNLSAHARVVVGARISKSGQPTAQPGDLQGLSAPVSNDARGVSVVIDAVVR